MQLENSFFFIYLSLFTRVLETTRSTSVRRREDEGFVAQLQSLHS